MRNVLDEGRGRGYLRLVHDLKTLCLLEGVLESFLVMLLDGFENC